ncbi:MAG: hypothetical protein ISR93_09260 [SAR324 cluster bacterium]|nr:hypothetical protein [Pseudomonadota bacterium]MBL7035917.1 hypothetical protein [SAR324 cluster bacterium]
MENNEIINKLHQAVKRINDLETELENIKQNNSWNFASIGKKRLISSLIVAGLLLSIVVIAGTVTKPHTFTDGTVISASQVNANFETLFNLVNGNLTSENIASIDASDITTGTINAARIPNLDASKITSGTIDSSRIASSDNASSDRIILFEGGGFLGSAGAMTNQCIELKIKYQIPGSNVRPFISTKYKNIKDIIPSDKVSLPVYGPTGILVSSTWTGMWDGYIDASLEGSGVLEGSWYWWTGSNTSGVLDTTTNGNCNSWSSQGYGKRGDPRKTDANWIATDSGNCGNPYDSICVAW